MLNVLGLGDDEELAYRALVEMAATDATELARQLRVRKSDAARALLSLEQRGLAARSSESNERYVASPPSIALAALLLERQDELRRAEADIARLTDAYRRAESRRTVSDAVDVVHGRQAVGQRFIQLQAAAREEVNGFVKPQPAAVSRKDNTAEDAAVERGVGYKIVVEQSALDQPGFLTDAEEALANGELVRVTTRVPIRMIIVDRKIALVPMISGEDTTMGALIVHGSGLLDGLIALFEAVWRDSFPLTLGDRGVAMSDAGNLGGTDARVLELLLAGFTDDAIAGHLRLSTRTVQRRVRALMDVAGVTTRLQLGYQAATRGWA